MAFKGRQPLAKVAPNHPLRQTADRLRAETQWRIRQELLVIKNTYRTLMTRGMKGCYVFSADPDTRDYVRRALIQAPAPEETRA